MDKLKIQCDTCKKFKENVVVVKPKDDSWFYESANKKPKQLCKRCRK